MITSFLVRDSELSSADCTYGNRTCQALRTHVRYHWHGNVATVEKGIATVELHERIRQRRNEKNISASELARRAEISKAYMSEIESGRATRPSADVLYRIAVALGTSIADLLGRQVKPAAREVPTSLQQFADAAGIPAEDVEMLANIRYRGGQPKTVDDWRFLYESIRRSVTENGT